MCATWVILSDRGEAISIETSVNSPASSRVSNGKQWEKCGSNTTQCQSCMVLSMLWADKQRVMIYITG